MKKKDHRHRTTNSKMKWQAGAIIIDDDYWQQRWYPLSRTKTAHTQQQWEA